MNTPVAQLTFYTCGLACLESYLRDIGILVDQGDFLKHHRDLCDHPIPQEGFYGALGIAQFQELCRRYKLKTDISKQLTKEQIKDSLAKLGGIVAITEHFGGGNGPSHATRVVECDDSETLTLMVPSFFLAAFQKVTLTAFVSWNTTFIVISADPSGH